MLSRRTAVQSLRATTRPRLRSAQSACFATNTTSFSSPTEGIPPPLEGVRILDLTTALAGPSATMYLADLGAEVIKVEPPKRGDDTRHWGPRFQHQNPSSESWALNYESTFFSAFNRNKRSITINLKTEEGQKLGQRLSEKVDVVVENMITGKATQMNMGYEKLKEKNPGLIYCSVTGYGQTGPYRKAPGYDNVIAGEAGIVHCTGEPDRPPVRPMEIGRAHV